MRPQPCYAGRPEGRHRLPSPALQLPPSTNEEESRPAQVTGKMNVAGGHVFPVLHATPGFLGLAGQDPQQHRRWAEGQHVPRHASTSRAHGDDTHGASPGAAAQPRELSGTGPYRA